MGGRRRAPKEKLADTLEQTVAATGLPDELAGRLVDVWELPQAVTGRALRADHDELLHLAVSVLAALGRGKAALMGMRTSWAPKRRLLL